MIRKFSLATVLVAAIALPAVAEDKKMIDPSGSTGPTDTMTDQVPQMKRDAEAIKKAGPAEPLPSRRRWRKLFHRCAPAAAAADDTGAS